MPELHKLNEILIREGWKALANPALKGVFA
jgi:hypothetical protein